MINNSRYLEDDVSRAQGHDGEKAVEVSLRSQLGNHAKEINGLNDRLNAAEARLSQLEARVG